MWRLSFQATSVSIPSKLLFSFEIFSFSGFNIFSSDERVGVSWVWLLLSQVLLQVTSESIQNWHSVICLCPASSPVVSNAIGSNSDSSWSRRSANRNGHSSISHPIPSHPTEMPVQDLSSLLSFSSANDITSPVTCKSLSRNKIKPVALAVPRRHCPMDDFNTWAFLAKICFLFGLRLQFVVQK